VTKPSAENDSKTTCRLNLLNTDSILSRLSITDFDQVASITILAVMPVRRSAYGRLQNAFAAASVQSPGLALLVQAWSRADATICRHAHGIGMQVVAVRADETPRNP
jgi:hypothetical protein